MAAAALIISVVSLFVAGLAAKYTRDVATVERGRRHDEREPKFTATFDHRTIPTGKGESADLVAFAYDDGPGDLDLVEVTLVHRNEAIHPPLVTIAADLGEPLHVTCSLATPFALGQERIARVTRHPDEHGGVVPFRLRCRQGDDEWTFVVYCDVPGVPTFQVF